MQPSDTNAYPESSCRKRANKPSSLQGNLKIRGQSDSAAFIPHLQTLRTRSTGWKTSSPKWSWCNYDRRGFYPRGEKNGRLKKQMTASGDVMTMSWPLPGTGSTCYAEDPSTTGRCHVPSSSSALASPFHPFLSLSICDE